MLGDSRGRAAEVVPVDEGCAAVSRARGVYEGGDACRELSGKVSLESLHKAFEFAESFNEYQIRSLVVSDEVKDEMTRLEKLRLKEVEVRIVGLLEYYGFLELTFSQS